MEASHVAEEEAGCFRHLLRRYSVRRNPLQPTHMTLTQDDHSCCVAAGLRMNNSVDIDRARDKTFAFAGLALSCLVEVSCGLIILCAPSTLQIFNHVKPQNMTSKLPSWTQSSNRKRSTPRALEQDSTLMCDTTNLTTFDSGTTWAGSDYHKLDDSSTGALAEVKPKAYTLMPSNEYVRRPMTGHR
jgi:hypothetical protein